jgi:hypothetical protein
MIESIENFYAPVRLNPTMGDVCVIKNLHAVSALMRQMRIELYVMC